MRSTISIITSSGDSLDSDFIHLAGDFENVHPFLLENGCNLSAYLYDPDDGIDEDYIQQFGETKEQILFLRKITSNDFHPVTTVLDSLRTARKVCESISPSAFEYGKEEFLEDLGYAVKALEGADQNVSGIQLLWLPI